MTNSVTVLNKVCGTVQNGAQTTSALNYLLVTWGEFGWQHGRWAGGLKDDGCRDYNVCPSRPNRGADNGMLLAQ